MGRIKKLMVLMLIFTIPAFFILAKPSSAQFNRIIETIVGDPDKDSGSGGGTGPMLSCDSGNYKQCLSDQFNITVQGAYRDSDLRDTYRGFRQISPYKTYLSLLRRLNYVITYSSAAKESRGAWGINNGNRMTLYRCVFDCSSQGIRYTYYFMIHEGAHGISSLIDQKQYALYHLGINNNRNCYGNIGIIKTYPPSLAIKMGLTFDRKVRESWAESVSNTIQCRSGGNCPANGSDGVSINNWPSNCSSIFDFVNKNID